jgi:FMN reductase
VVVQAGLGQPSSSRLLADRLATATVDALLERGDGAEVATEPQPAAAPVEAVTR